MPGPDATPADASTRELVRFYLVDHRTFLGKAIDVALLLVNVVFVSILVIETYPTSAEVRQLLWSLEIGVALVLLVEYALRLYGAANRTAEFVNPYTVVDLVSLLPTLVVLVLPLPATAMNIGFLRVLRVLRALRFYRFTRDQEFFFGTLSVEALRATKLLLTVLVVLFTTAGLFFSFEHAANPAVSNFGDAFYYTVVAVTTVGFGDIIPVTALGRWVTVAAILVGIVVIPWQASKIIKEWTHRGKINVTCPVCGLAYHDSDASHCKACGSVIYHEYDSRE
jgi:voltage-gated potassium channel